MPVKSREEASSHVRQLAHLASLLECQKALLNAELLEVQTRHEAAIQTIQQDIKQREEELMEWSDVNRKQEFGKSQSLEFSHGTIQYRLGKEALGLYAGYEWGDVLSKVLSFGVDSHWDRFVNRSPSLDLQKLLSMAKGKCPSISKDELKSVGVRLVRAERFTIKVKPEMEGTDATAT